MTNLDIRPLPTLELDEILPIITGYESDYKYAIEKTESDEQTVFTIRLVKLATPYRTDFVQDFNEEDRTRFISYLPQGYSFGAYVGEQLAGFAISEVEQWNNSIRIWEFQIKREFRGQGIGRALMEHVVEKARQGGFRIVSLETQNTNVPAIRFYRKLGFSLDALDLWAYTNHDVESGEVCFYMKRKLE